MRNISANELPVTAPPEVEREQNSRNHFPLLLFQYQETFHIVKRFELHRKSTVFSSTHNNYLITYQYK